MMGLDWIGFDRCIRNGRGYVIIDGMYMHVPGTSVEEEMKSDDV